MRKYLTVGSLALLGVVASLLAASLPTAHAQQAIPATPAADPAIKVVDPALRADLPEEGRVNIRVDDFPSRFPADGPWHANHEMRLRSDGNLPGQLRAFDAAGNLTPVRARLFFIQNDQVVGRAASDEMGRFQIVGIPPGAYSIVVASSEAFGALSLRVLENGSAQQLPPPKVKSITEPHVKQIANSQQPVANTAADFLTLDISLVPAAHFAAMSQIIREQIPNFPLAGGAGRAAPALGALGAGAGAAIGGGGGGGLSAALGAAAAGGAAAALGASQNNNNGTSQTTESNGGS